MGWGGYGECKGENNRTSASSSPHAESSWRLKEFAEGAVTIGMVSLFQYFTTRVEKDAFLRRRRLGPCRTFRGWPLKPGRTGGIKKRLESRSYPPETIFYTTMRSSRRPLTMFATCMEFPGLPLARDDWSGGARYSCIWWGWYGGPNLPTNSRHCGGSSSMSLFDSFIALGRSLTNNKNRIARSLTPEVPHSWSLSRATTHRQIAVGRFFLSG